MKMFTVLTSSVCTLSIDAMTSASATRTKHAIHALNAFNNSQILLHVFNMSVLYEIYIVYIP